MKNRRKTKDKSKNIKLKNTLKRQKLQEKGITLIALVVTIIILLILAGVTLNIALSDNGLFNKAQFAVKKYDVASEQEVLQQQILFYQLDNSTTQIGKVLSDKKSIADSNWNIIQMNNSDQKYGTNYNYIPKGTEIQDYGKTKYNWVINYNNGEVINIDDYTELNGNAGISITTDIALNINPLNISNKSDWGEGATFIGDDGDGNSGPDINELKLKFDGEDDYLNLENVEIEKSRGFTFEFYGKAYDSQYIYPLQKICLSKETNEPDRLSNFRTLITSSSFGCCFGKGDSGSDLKRSGATHWFDFTNVNLKNEDGDVYVSVTCDLSSGEVILYIAGKNPIKTTCSIGYLESSEDLFDSEVPFTVGLSSGGTSNEKMYSKFDLYACRLYTRVLNEGEIKLNYDESVGYRKNMLNIEE